MHSYRKRKCEYLVIVLFFAIVNITLAELIGYWNLDLVTNAITPDITINGNDATLIGNTSLVTGKYENAIICDGDNDYLSIPENATVFDRTFTAFTAMAWINPTTEGAYDYLMGKMGAAGQRGWDFWINQSIGQMRVTIYGNAAGTTSDALAAIFAIPSDKWTHIAFTFKANDTLAIYTNGFLTISKNTTLAILNGANTSTLNIGKRGTAGSDTWNGKIDDVKIYNTALSAEEIQIAATSTTTTTTNNNTELRVVRYGDDVFIRSVFSLTQDLVVRMSFGRNNQINFNNTRLISASAGMTEGELNGGRCIHYNSDDAAPWKINHTYIGANHGCSDARELTVTGHGLTTTELGSEWQDNSGRKYYIIKIVDSNKIQILSEDVGTGNLWDFDNTISGTTLNSTTTSSSLTFSNNALAQIIPACRISNQAWLVNGTTPLATGIVTNCNYFDIVDEYDIINPASLLNDIITHPGENRDYAASHLDGVIRNEITYRFHPNGANIIYYNASALQAFQLDYTGFVQSSMLNKKIGETLEYYIPKTIPFTQDSLNYNFKMLQDFTFTLPGSLNFTNDKIEDPQNRPERFIQLLGEVEGGQTNRQIGYAIGYSPIHGLTQPEQRATNIDNSLFLYKSSKKSYPHAIDSAMTNIIQVGTELHCIAYRHYINLTEQTNATCVYWQHQKNDIVLYVDYHKSVNHDIIQLPIELKGKSINIIDKTSSLTLHTPTVSQTGTVSVSVTGGYGYAVFKLSNTGTVMLISQNLI